jgi:hypothetical protein
VRCGEQDSWHEQGCKGVAHNKFPDHAHHYAAVVPRTALKKCRRHLLPLPWILGTPQRAAKYASFRRTISRNPLPRSSTQIPECPTLRQVQYNKHVKLAKELEGSGDVGGALASYEEARYATNA